MAESGGKVCPKETRQSNAVFGIGTGITRADPEITGSKLPTNSQILRCYMFHQHEGLTLNRTRHENAKIVLKQIIPFYNKANIPTITEKKHVRKLFHCFKRMQSSENFQ